MGKTQSCLFLRVSQHLLPVGGLEPFQRVSPQLLVLGEVSEERQVLLHVFFFAWPIVRKTFDISIQYTNTMWWQEP